jgi:hypothetical protein
MNLEPMLLLTIAEERRRRLIEEAARERLVRDSSPLGGEVRPQGGVGDAVRSALRRRLGVGPSLP